MKNCFVITRVIKAFSKLLPNSAGCFVLNRLKIFKSISAYVSLCLKGVCKLSCWMVDADARIAYSCILQFLYSSGSCFSA